MLAKILVISFLIIALAGFVIAGTPFVYGVPLWVGITMLCVGCLGMTIVMIVNGRQK